MRRLLTKNNLTKVISYHPTANEGSYDLAKVIVYTDTDHDNRKAVADCFKTNLEAELEYIRKIKNAELMGWVQDKNAWQGSGHPETPAPKTNVQANLKQAQRNSDNMALIASMLDNVVAVAKGKNMQHMDVFSKIITATNATNREADLALDYVGGILESPEYTLSCAYRTVCSSPRNGGFDYNGYENPTFKFEYADDIDAVLEGFMRDGISYSYDKSKKTITVKL